MKPNKKKKAKDELDAELDDTRVVPFEALAELTSSDVINEVKMGMSRIEPLEHEGDFGEESAA
jgi:hypothetical protein